MAEAPEQPKKTDSKTDAKTDAGAADGKKAGGGTASSAGKTSTPATAAKSDSAAKPTGGAAKADQPAAAKDGAKDAPKDSPKDAAKDNKDAAPGGKSSSVPPSGATAAKSASPAAATAKPPVSGGRSAVTLVIIVLLIGVGAFVTRTAWLPIAQPYLAKIPGFGGAAPTTASTDLEARIIALEEKIAAAGDDNALQRDSARVQADLARAMARIDDLDRRLGEVRDLATALTADNKTGVDLTAIMTRIDDLEAGRQARAGEIAALTKKLETATAGSGSAGQGLILAVAQLRDAASSGQPFAAQLEALRKIAGDDPEITAAASSIAGYADKGLPSVADLQSRFAALAGDIVVEARAAGGDWVDQATARLATLVQLRRTDGKSGDAVEDAIAVIEKQLSDDDLAGAANTASELSDTLSDGPKATLEPWLLDLKARLTAARALDAMRASAYAALERR